MNSTSELDITVINSPGPVGLGCMSHWQQAESADGEVTKFMHGYSVNDAAAFREKLSVEEGRDENLSMSLKLLLPQHRQDDGFTFLGLRTLLEKVKPPLPRLPGETLSEHWYRDADRHRALQDVYGVDSLSLYLDETGSATKSKVTWPSNNMDHTPCSLWLAGEFVFATMSETHFAVPNVGREERQAIAIRNEMRGLVTPPELETWAREHAALGQQLMPVVPAPALTTVAWASNFGGDRDFHFGLTKLDCQGAWLTNEDEGFKYFQGKAVSVSYKPPEIFSEDWWIQQREKTLAALDRRFASIRNDMTADIVDVMFHHWRITKKKQSATGVEKTAITLRQICEYRGITANKSNLERAYLSMRDVRCFRFTSASVEEALFEIATYNPQPALWGSEEPPHADIAFVYSPGYFLSQALEGEPIFVAPFMRRVWELDPYRHAHAKRLIRYLRGEWRMNMGKYLRAPGQTPTRYRTWSEVLTDSGINFEQSEATKNPQRFIKSINDALSTLYDLEAIRECGGTVCHAEDLSNHKSKGRKGAFARWLNLRVCIEPPADVREALHESNARRAGFQLAQMQAQAKAKGLPTGKAPAKTGRAVSRSRKKNPSES